MLLAALISPYENYSKSFFIKTVHSDTMEADRLSDFIDSKGSPCYHSTANYFRICKKDSTYEKHYYEGKCLFSLWLMPGLLSGKTLTY